MELKHGNHVEFGEVVTDEHRAWARAEGKHLMRLQPVGDEEHPVGRDVDCDPSICWCGGVSEEPSA